MGSLTGFRDYLKNLRTQRIQKQLQNCTASFRVYTDELIAPILALMMQAFAVGPGGQYWMKVEAYHAMLLSSEKFGNRIE